MNPVNTNWKPQLQDYTKNSLSPSLCFLAHAALFASIPQLDHLKSLVQLAQAQDMDETKLQEVLLQSYLFLGFPKTINALAAVKDLWKNPPEAFETEIELSVLTERGEVLCEKIYGSNYSKLLITMQQIHPDLKRYMIQEGYGKNLSRGILTPLEREFGILPILIYTQVPKQLHSHFLGTLYLGATFDQLVALVNFLKGPLNEDFLAPTFSLLERIRGK